MAYFSGLTSGGHAMVLVGFDDTTRMFVVRNSWGADWGDHGYCYISYDFFTHTEPALQKTMYNPSWVSNGLGVDGVRLQ